MTSGNRSDGAIIVKAHTRDTIKAARAGPARAGQWNTMYSRLRQLAPITLVLALGAGGPHRLWASGSPQQPQQSSEQTTAPERPTFRSGIDVVRVDVIVTDNRTGRQVADLTQSDFEITEDNRPQKIESFRLVQAGGGKEPGGEPPRQIRTSLDEENEAGRDNTRLFALFLDDYHVRRAAGIGVKEPLVRFIQSQMGPADMLGIMYPLTPIADVTLTRNHVSSIEAIQRFTGRKYDYEPRNSFEEQYALYPASTVERIRNQVSLMALRSLVTHLGGLREGRKAIILVSEGYTNYLPPQLESETAGLGGFGSPNRYDPAAVENDPRSETAKFFSDVDLQNDLRDLCNYANRNNTAIYTLDPRGLASFGADIDAGVSLRTDADMLRSTTDTLRMLAEQTDGRAIVGRNDLQTALRQVVVDSSVYYLLGYSSSTAPSDGKFHEIKVRVKRPGVQVRARKGYWALTAEETARALAPPKPGPPPEIGVALASIVEPARERVVRTWVGTSRGENGRTRVTFAWEPVPPTPGLRRDDPVRLLVNASAAGGETYFRGRVPDVSVVSAAPPGGTVDGTGRSSPQELVASAPSRVVFDAAPGRMQLRLSVEGAAGQVLDTEVREIDVPDLMRTEVQLSTPVLFRARNALELRLLSADRNAVPTPSRQFRRTERVLIRFEVYAPGTLAPATEAKLLNRAGQSIFELTPQPFVGGEKTWQIDVPLAGLAAGEYLVEMKASAENSEAKALVAFRVGS